MSPNVAKIIASAEISQVRLLDGSMKTTIRSLEEVSEHANSNVGHSVKLRGRFDDGSFVIYVRLEVRVFEQVEPSDMAGVQPVEVVDPVLVVSAGFELIYKVPDIAQYSDDDLAEFASSNGMFNVWSYWREFVHSATGRMGLPPLVMPLYRWKGKKVDAKQVSTVAKQIPEKVADAPSAEQP